MLNLSKILCTCALLISSALSCTDKSQEAKVTSTAKTPESSQEAAKETSVPPPATTTPEPEKKKEPEFVRIGRLDPSGKYSLAMRKDTSDVVIADQRGMITPIPFDSTPYADVSFSDPSSTGLMLIVANKSESAETEDLGPVDFELFSFTIGAEKVIKLPLKLPGKQLLGWSLADNYIALASGGQDKGKFNLKITVTDQAGKQLAEYTPPAVKAPAYELAVNSKGDVFGLIQFDNQKKPAQSFFFKNGKPVSKLYVPKSIASLSVSLDSMDAEGNVIASKPGGDTLEIYKFNPLKADGKVEKLNNRSAS